jgi:hypothetical protein
MRTQILRPSTSLSVIKLEPEQELLDRYNLDSPQDAMVTASALILRNMSIQTLLGDRFDFDEWQYEIKTAKEGSWFSNSKFPCEWIITADRTHRRWPK